MRWLWTALPGVAVLAFAFHEVFQDLFHPTQSGALSEWIGRTSFRLLRRWPSILSLAGPLTLVIVIMLWASLQAVGFALIYCTNFPGGFQLGSSEHASGFGGFWTMLYFSVQVMTTMGTGDLRPKPGWLRILVSIQALVGFALITASVSSIVLIYPPLSRMRTLARFTETLLEAAKRTGVDVVSSFAQDLLNGLAVNVIQARVDFIHFPVLYYFHADRRRSSLARALPNLLGFAEQGLRPEISEPVRLASSTLQTALEDLAQVLSDRFIHSQSNDPAAIFRAYAKDHVVAYEGQ